MVNNKQFVFCKNRIEQKNLIYNLKILYSLFLIKIPATTRYPLVARFNET